MTRISRFVRCKAAPWGRGRRPLDYSVRRILQFAAGASSAGASLWGLLTWRQAEAGTHASLPVLLACLLATLIFPVFALYLRWPRTGVVLAWLLLSASWFVGFLVHLQICAGQSCTTVDTLRIAWRTITLERHLWLVLAAAVCLLLDYSDVAVEKLRATRQSAANSRPGE